MKIPVDDIPQSPKEISFFERIEELNELYSKEPAAADFRFPPQLGVSLVYHRFGADLFFRGRLEGEIAARCGRCLDDYVLRLDRRFDCVLTPVPAKTARGAEEIRSEELGLSYYATDEIDLAPLIGEQVMLALPTRPLCKDACRGLCGLCGANLNSEICGCSQSAGDPRMAIFRTLKLGR